jgi:hypothetical protein
MHDLAVESYRAKSVVLTVVSSDVKGASEAAAAFRDAQLSIALNTGQLLREVKPEEQVDYTRPDQYPLTREMIRKGVSLVPSEDQIRAELTQPVPSIPQEPHKKLWQVVLAVFLEALGIRDVVERFGPKVIDLVTGDKFLTTAFDDLAKAVARQDMALVALRTEQILDYLFGLAGPLETLLGEAAAAEMFAAIGARFVPFLGWALWIASFVIAIADNWEDIRPFLE